MLPFPVIVKYGNIIPTGTIKKISTGYNFIVVLYTNGDLYGLGTNAYGQFGLGNTGSLSSWFKIKSNVQDVWCGGQFSYTMVVQQDNKLYYSGKTEWLSGSGTSFTSTSTILFDLTISGTTHSVRDLQCNGNTLSFVLSNNALYMSGSWVGYVGGNYALPVLRSSLCLSISLGISTSYYLDTSNVLYGTGVNNYYQIVNTSAANQMQWVAVTNGSSVIGVQAGNLTLYVLKSNGWYTVGNGALGVLGNGGTSNKTALSTVVVPSAGVQPLMSACVTYGSVLGTAAGIYGTGQGSYIGLTQSQVFVYTKCNIDSTATGTDIGISQLVSTNNCVYYVKNGKVYGTGGTAGLLPGTTSASGKFAQITLPL